MGEGDVDLRGETSEADAVAFWSAAVTPLAVRLLVAAGRALVVAGRQDVVVLGDAVFNVDDPQHGGRLLARLPRCADD